MSGCIPWCEADVLKSTVPDQGMCCCSEYCLPLWAGLAPQLPLLIDFTVSWAPGTSRPSLLQGTNVWLQLFRNKIFKSFYYRISTLNNVWSLKSVKINNKAISCSYYLVLKIPSSSCVNFFVNDVQVTQWGAEWNSDMLLGSGLENFSLYLDLFWWPAVGWVSFR